VSLSIEIQGVETLCSQLETLSPDARDRRMLARRMGRKVVTLDLRRVRKQKNIDGTPFAPRKDKRNRRRLLEAIHRNIVVYGQGDGAKVTYRGKYAEFAFQQQFGVGKEWTNEEAARCYGHPDYGAPATRRQARALVFLGYRRGGKRRGWRRVTVLQIEKTMTLGQAGRIIREMRGGLPPGTPIRWNDRPPKRVALGVTDKEAEKLTEQVCKSQLKQLDKQLAASGSVLGADGIWHGPKRR